MSKEVHFSLNDCNFSFGKKQLFKNLSFTIHQSDKIALVGKNGVGKTSLLKIISREKLIDSGDFWINPKISLGFLNQKEKRNESTSVFKFLSSSLKVPLVSNKYKIENICEKMKLNQSQNVSELSGGTKRRLNLASIIINEPELLLLDEPTNHLDIESIRWLEYYLINDFKGSFLVISHNRSFLKNITNKVFWMDRGIIKVSPKGFYNFKKWSKELIEQEKREFHNKEKFLDSEIDWLSKGITARRKRNIRRKKNIYEFGENLKKERSEFLKSIAKTKIIIDEKNFDSPNLLINFFNVKKKFFKDNKENIILKEFNYKLMRGQKIGIIGKNGSGKSTLLNLIANKDSLDEGNIKIRKNVGISFFDQSGSQFNDNKTIKENLIPGGGDYIRVGEKKMHICGYLKNFLFEPKLIDMEVGFLSGGERNRLLLAKILASPKEVLLLDEPTNDLDIETIDLLIDFLNQFPGGVFVASHDMDFLEKTADKFFVMDGKGNVKTSLEITQNIFDPGYDNLEKKKILKNNENRDLKRSLKLDYENRTKKVLKKIEKKEKIISDLSKELENENLDYVENNIQYKKIVAQLKKNQSELKDLEYEWFELEEKSLNEE